MDVFALAERVTERYGSFARSFTTIRSSELKHKVDERYANRQFWPEPLLQLAPAVARFFTATQRFPGKVEFSAAEVPSTPSSSIH